MQRPDGIARANRRRGEIEAEIDGERRILCLTLGALAELETAFAVDDLAGLAARFSNGRLRAADMIRILGAGLRGGGNVYSDDDVATANVEGGIGGYAALVRDLLAATFLGDGAETAPDPTEPQPAAVPTASRQRRPPFPGAASCMSASACCGFRLTSSGR